MPQGSILSSLLFLVYLNDIDENIKSDMYLFADDVALLNRSKNVNSFETELNSDLLKLNDWAFRWNMDFNPSKTEMIIFSNKRLKSEPNICLKNVKIKQVREHKHLGILLSEDMKWTAHIEYVVGKSRKKLGLLRRQSRKLKIDIYRTMIRPVLEYGSVLFDNCSAYDNLKLESCQRTAALICTGAMRRTETKLLLEHLEWDSLHDRHKISKTSLFFKIMNKLTPPYLLGNITLNQPQTQNLRHYNEIIPPRCRLQSYKTSFFPNGMSTWNALPDKIKKAENIRIFKKEMEKQFNFGTYKSKANPLDHTHDDFFGKILTQIKLKLSPLKSQLFNYNLIDNPFCPACNDCIETPLHYFTECVAHNDYRRTMVTNLLELNPNLSSPVKILDFIINGSKITNLDERINIK